MRNIRNFRVDEDKPWYTRVFSALFHFALWFAYALRDALATDLGQDYALGLALLSAGTFVLIGGLVFAGWQGDLPWSQVLAFAVLVYVFMGILHHRFINR